MNTEERLQQILNALEKFEVPITKKAEHILELIESKLDLDAERTFEEWNTITAEVEHVQKRALNLAQTANKKRIINELSQEITDEESLKKLLRVLVKHPDPKIAHATERALKQLETDYVHSTTIFS